MVFLANYKIEHDRQGCIGCGACAASCPENWAMASDGKSKCLKTELEELGCNETAASGCPVNVIHIIEAKSGKRLF